MPQGLSPLSTDVLPHKRQVVVDRLRRRMESYRRRQNDCQPRFDQSFTGLCEQNLQETLALKQRFLETKAKRGQNKNNKQDKKQHLQHQVPQPQSVVGPGGDGGAMSAAANAAALQSSVHVQQKFLKRTNDDMDNVNGPDGLEPPVKLQCTTQHNQAHGGHQGNEGPMKFSVEIVQQLEFTTSAANSQPQQISTNVTVKALTNASVKSDVASPKSSNPSTPASGSLRPNSNIGCVDIGTLVECKQEPDNDFADLDQCAAALEKDAQANGGNSFPGFSDLIGDDTSDEIINSEDLKNLISEISDLNPEFMKDFDFEDKSVIGANCSGVVSNNNNDIGNINSHPPNGMKVEDTKDLNLVHQQNQNVLDVKSSQSPMLQNAYSPPVYEGQGLNKSRIPYPNMDFTKTELSPAAQTLKQMAEQHQHKNQMGLAFNPAGTRVSNSRSPYTDFQFPGSDFIGGSPNSNQQNVNFHNKNSGFPQPPEMIKQELNMFNNQPKSGNGPSGPGMYKQQYSPYGSPSANHGSPGYMPRGGGPSGGPQNGPPPRPPSGPGGNPQQGGTTLQINQAQQLHISQPGHGIQVSAGQHLHLSGDLKGGVSVAAQQGMYFNQQQAAQQNQQQQHPHNTSHQQQQSAQNNPHGNGNGNGPNNTQNQQSQQQQNIHNQQNQHQQNNAQQNSAQQQSQLSMVQNQQLQQGDNFTVSQSQTINFTQQSLRQRAAAAAANNNPIGPSMTGRHPGPPQGSVIPGSMAEHPHAKLVQQQQMFRAQQAAAMQQQHMAGVRPPPPDYKASAALMHSGPTRFPTAPPTNIRRLTQQPMPPSGPMMRPHNMYMMGPQHMSRAAYPRPQGPIGMGNNDGVGMGPQHPGTDWRHILMTQQQNASYGNGPTQIRPAFQHQGFGMANTNNMQQMTAMQHQQMRMQQQNMATAVTGPLSGQSAVLGMGNQGPLGTGGPINSSSSMINQQIMSHTQQQSIMQQQGPNQMSISSMHMSQQQTMSIGNVNMHQQHQNNTQQQQLTNNLNSVVNNQQNNNPLANFGQSTPDFSLDFLETLPAGDTSNFSAQELLNSLDNEFNLQDIL